MGRNENFFLTILQTYRCIEMFHSLAQGFKIVVFQNICECSIKQLVEEKKIVANKLNEEQVLLKQTKEHSGKTEFSFF